MIWQGPAFAILMHIFAYLFNITLLIMLNSKRVVHSRIYMLHMIASELFMNITQNILVEFPYFVKQNPGSTYSPEIEGHALLIEKIQYNGEASLFSESEVTAFYSFWPIKLIEIFSQLGYQSKFYIAILMAINRLWVVLIPIGSLAFSHERLKLYLMLGWVLLFFRVMIIIVPKDCYFKMDLVQFQVMAVCENLENHQTRMLINKYISYFIHIFIPWVAVIINLIVYISIRRRKLKNSTSSKKGERILIINSLVISLILTANYLYNYCYSHLKPTISRQSDTIQSAFSFFNLYGCSCFNFLVYFVLDSATRKKVIATLKNEKQVGGVTLTVTTTF